MSKILHVISSPRGKDSNSIKLGEAIIGKLLEKAPHAAVHTRNLTTDTLPYLDVAHLNAFFTPADQHTEAHKEAIRYSNEAIAEIMDADVLVIGAPMYNFNISSTLKSWFDHISRAGVTFKYTSEGPVGLLTGKKVYIAIATGGVYSEEPYSKVDFLTPYLIYQLAFLGLDDTTVYRAEGFASHAHQDTALEKGIRSITIDDSVFPS